MIPFINQLKTMILKIDNPVGHIRLETTDINPATYLGFGTWTLWGAGKVPVGVDTNDIDFNTVEKTGGNKEVTLTIEQLPSHRHIMKPYYEQDTTHIFTMPQTGFVDRETSHTYYNERSSVKGYDGLFAGYTDFSGTDKAHSNVQPYITCYMWKRVA